MNYENDLDVNYDYNEYVRPPDKPKFERLISYPYDNCQSLLNINYINDIENNEELNRAIQYSLNSFKYENINNYDIMVNMLLDESQYINGEFIGDFEKINQIKEPHQEQEQEPHQEPHQEPQQYSQTLLKNKKLFIFQCKLSLK